MMLLFVYYYKSDKRFIRLIIGIIPLMHAFVFFLLKIYAVFDLVKMKM